MLAGVSALLSIGALVWRRTVESQAGIGRVVQRAQIADVSLAHRKQNNFVTPQVQTMTGYFATAIMDLPQPPKPVNAVLGALQVRATQIQATGAIRQQGCVPPNHSDVGTILLLRT